MTDSWTREIERIAFATTEQQHRIVGVTGTGRSSGVSRLCSHLAQVVAKSGKSVLLADFSGTARENDAAMSWLPGQAGAAACIRRDAGAICLLNTPFTPSSRFLFNNVERLRSTFRDELADFSAIIVDLPEIPARSDDRLNGAAIAAACDTVLLIALAGQTTQAALADSIEALTGARASIGGLVLNDRFNPTLGAELAREAQRLSRIAPRLSKRLERLCRASTFLN